MNGRVDVAKIPGSPPSFVYLEILFKSTLPMTMDLGPQPPPPPTLTLGSPPDNPPKKPPDKTMNQAPDNPFRDIKPKVLENLHKHLISKAISAVRAPFWYFPKDRFTYSRSTRAPLEMASLRTPSTQQS